MRRVNAQIFKNGKWVSISGNFHQWGLDSIEESNGHCTNFSVAIIELDNGNIVFSPPEKVVFINDPETKQWKSLGTKEWEDRCPDCGATVEIFSIAPAHLACDGDEARCSSCYKPGKIVCLDIDKAYVRWTLTKPAGR